MEKKNISNNTNAVIDNTINSGRDTNISVINNIYINSISYKELQEKKEILIKDLSRIPIDNLKWRSEKQQEIQIVEQETVELKETVTRLYNSFVHIKINTERLRIAKALFDEGKFKEADTALNAAEMKQELDDLIERENKLNSEKEEILEHRKNKANEYLIKAQTTYIDFDNPKRFEETRLYYEEALRSWENLYNLDAYAQFLYRNNQFTKAIFYYERILEKYGQQLPEDERAVILNNLGVFYSYNHRMVEALAAYEEALGIRRRLAETHPEAYLPDVAMTLNNIGNLHRANHRMVDALAAYKEALGIRRRLAETHPEAYLPNVANTLNNIGILHSDNHRMADALAAYKEALGIYRRLAETHPEAYLPDVAMTLNNIGNLHSDNHRMADALAAYKEALGIYRRLAGTLPEAYLPDVAMTLNNLGILHSDNHRMVDALAAYEEALGIYRRLAGTHPEAYLPVVAATLNNIGALHSDNHRMVDALAAYEEALGIRRRLAETHPEAYLPDVAMTLNNIGNLHRANHRMVDALAAYKEALGIRRRLAETHPEAYLPDVAMTLINLSIFYQKDKEKSIALVTEAIFILLPILDKIPFTQKYFQSAITVLKNWEIDPEKYITALLNEMQKKEVE